jgi:hypothetical protein
MTTYTYDNLHDLLYDAQANLFEAIDRIEAYVRATNDIEADNYLLAQLKILASRQHSYLSSDLNIDDLLERLDDREPADDDSDDDGYPYSSIDADTPTDDNGHYWSESLNRYVTIPTDED